MDLEVVKDKLTVKKNLSNIKKDITLEEDYILPDIKPDILSVICSSGNTFIAKREMIGNKVKLDGGINLNITYLSASGECKVLNPEISFSELIDTSLKNEDCDLIEKVDIKKIDVKILNERKILIRVLLDVNIQLCVKSDIEVLKDIGNLSDLQKLEEKVMVKNLIGNGETKAQIKENIKLDESDNITDIISLDISLKNIENKISYNKVLIKADCILKIIYLTEDNRVCKKIQEIPVMGFIDVLNIDENNICETRFCIKNIFINLDSTEDHSIYIEIDFDIFSDVYENKEINLIEDIYGLRSNINYTVREESNILAQDEEVIDYKEINEKVLIENINELFDVKQSINIVSRTEGKEVVNYEAEIVLMYLFSSFDNQNINSKEIRLSFNFDVPREKDRNIRLNIDDNSSFEVLPDSTVDSKININIISDGDKKEINVIDNIEISDFSDDDAYSMVIYFVQKGDSLWKIAKKFRSTVEEIVKVNEIEEADKIDIGQRLYIPRAV